MRKILSYIALSLITVGGAYAEVLTPEAALDRVSQTAYFVSAGPVSRAGQQPLLKATIKAHDGVPAIYLFDNGRDAGYMIVSADDATAPLLGYADQGTIDPDNMPPALRYWLNHYQKQIEYSRNSEFAAETRGEDTRAGITLPNWTNVGPLVQTVWNQDAPFNNLCPLDGNARSYTGCVATSMSQVMKYFNYPNQGQGRISYDCESLGTALSLNFADLTLDWNNMIANYNGSYTEAQGNAVATLMQAAGYSVQMNYSAYESGALSGRIPTALVNYFNYDKGVTYATRDMFTYTQWAQMIYDNLKNVGPVIYDGSGDDGGHSWVCDGFRNGYFHMNWGWGGMSDGYYLLDSLSPSSLGIGGGMGNFNYNQDVILNIKPASGTSGTPQSEVYISGTVWGSVSGSALYLFKDELYVGWSYQGLQSLDIKLGLSYVDANNPNATPVYTPSTKNYFITMQSGLYIKGYDVPFNLNSLPFENGVKYKITAAYQTKDDVWHNAPAPLGAFNYCYLTKNNNKYTVENVPELEFTGTSLSIDSELINGSSVMATMTLVNNNTTELTRSVALGLKDSKGKLAFLGSNQFVSLAPNGSATFTWTTKLTRQSGTTNVTTPTDFTPCLYDSETQVIFYTSPNTVTMQPSAGSLSITVNFEIEDAPMLENNVYDVEAAANFNVLTNLSVTRGYFSDQLYIGIFSRVGDTDRYNLDATYPVGEFTFLHSGETKSWTTNINFQTARVGETYGIAILNSSSELVSGRNINQQFFVSGIGEAGVETITTSAEEIKLLVDRASSRIEAVGGKDGIVSLEAYYVNGMKAPLQVEYINGKGTADLSSLANGIVIITATDKAGNRKTLKLAK